ncbi:unnamed protein product [Nezara viridula]|uniref:Uncharacterized protein n=1 Tax=Nezara viridula TaxID=85310 RepID=A0A9P0DZV6_NEZVI|nr:unnamed protein product [Nezara viridula]
MPKAISSKDSLSFAFLCSRAAYQRRSEVILHCPLEHHMRQPRMLAQTTRQKVLVGPRLLKPSKIGQRSVRRFPDKSSLQRAEELSRKEPVTHVFLNALKRTGSVRGEDIPYALGLPLTGGLPHFPQNYTAEDIAVSKRFIHYLANFARKGYKGYIQLSISTRIRERKSKNCID